MGTNTSTSPAYPNTGLQATITMYKLVAALLIISLAGANAIFYGGYGGFGMGLGLGHTTTMVHKKVHAMPMWGGMYGYPMFGGYGLGYGGYGGFGGCGGYGLGGYGGYGGWGYY